MNSFGRHGLQVVLAEDQADGVARWIAVACRSLPRALARRLTFTTYTRRPYQSSQQVIGIMPGADFSFTHAELSVQYRVHAGPAVQPPGRADVLGGHGGGDWLDGRPELFDEAYADVFVPDGSPDEAWTDALTGQLAATALAAGYRATSPGHDRRRDLGYRPRGNPADPAVLAGSGGRGSAVFWPDPGI